MVWAGLLLSHPVPPGLDCEGSSPQTLSETSRGSLLSARCSDMLGLCVRKRFTEGRMLVLENEESLPAHFQASLKTFPAAPERTTSNFKGHPDPKNYWSLTYGWVIKENNDQIEIPMALKIPGETSWWNFFKRQEPVPDYLLAPSLISTRKKLTLTATFTLFPWYPRNTFLLIMNTAYDWYLKVYPLQRTTRVKGKGG